jgi:hypothetical protein
VQIAFRRQLEANDPKRMGMREQLYGALHATKRQCENVSQILVMVNWQEAMAGLE